MNELATELEAKPHMPKKERDNRDRWLGVKGRSILQQIPGFDIVHDVPAEYMHLAALGVAKHLCQLSFDAGKCIKGTREQGDKRCPVGPLNKALMATKVLNNYVPP